MVLRLDGYLEIQLNADLSGASRMTTLIFEMANASRHRDHQQVDLAADRGLIRTAGEFGLAHEMIEYEALRMHRQILFELESRAGPLPTEFFYYVTPAPRSTGDYRLPDLFQYLKAQRESGHTEHYYKRFDQRKSGQEKPNDGGHALLRLPCLDGLQGSGILRGRARRKKYGVKPNEPLPKDRPQ